MTHFTSAMLFALYMVVVILFPVWDLVLMWNERNVMYSVCTSLKAIVI